MKYELDTRNPRLTLFPPGTDPARRRRRKVFLAIYVAIVLLLTWPVYPFFSQAFPLVLGLPFSLAWVVAALVLMFGTLVWLYRSDEEGHPHSPPVPKPQRAAAETSPRPTALHQHDQGPVTADGPPPSTGRGEGVLGRGPAGSGGQGG